MTTRTKALTVVLSILVGAISSVDGHATSVSEPVATAYSKHFGVTLVEARRRLGMLQSIETMDKRMRAGSPSTFGGMWVEHAPTFQVKVMFVGDFKFLLSKYTNDSFYVGVSTPVTLATLTTVQNRAQYHMSQEHIPFETDIDARSGVVTVYVLPGMLQRPGVQRLASQQYISLKEVPSLSKLTALIIGGLQADGPTERCTTGFDV